MPWPSHNCCSHSTPQLSGHFVLLPEFGTWLPGQMSLQMPRKRAERQNRSTAAWFALALVQCVLSLLALWRPFGRTKKSSRCPLRQGLSLAEASRSVTLSPISYAPSFVVMTDTISFSVCRIQLVWAGRFLSSCRCFSSCGRSRSSGRLLESSAESHAGKRLCPRRGTRPQRCRARGAWHQRAGHPLRSAEPQFTCCSDIYLRCCGACSSSSWRKVAACHSR